MELIVLVDRNWAIGQNGDQIVRIKQDLARFRALTEDQVVLYGRKTLQTFPGGKALPKRENWVLSRDKQLKVPGAIVLHDLQDVFAKVKLAEAAGKKVFVIGGANVYEQLLPYCTGAHVTLADREWQEADCWFPRLTDLHNWLETWRSVNYEAGNRTPFLYRFMLFENKQPLPLPDDSASDES